MSPVKIKRTVKKLGQKKKDRVFALNSKTSFSEAFFGISYPERAKFGRCDIGMLNNQNPLF